MTEKVNKLSEKNEFIDNYLIHDIVSYVTTVASRITTAIRLSSELKQILFKSHNFVDKYKYNTATPSPKRRFTHFAKRQVTGGMTVI